MDDFWGAHNEAEAVPAPTNAVRTFATGATRDTDKGKLDYEAFLSPLALEAYARYMDKNRVQSDGKLRAGDNWQKGMPLDEYMKSLWRHLVTAWKLHRQWRTSGTLEDALCGVLFNAFGYLHEMLLSREREQREEREQKGTER